MGFTGRWNQGNIFGVSASIHQAEERLTARSLEVSKPRDSSLFFSNSSQIKQAPRQQRCRDACQISERCDHHSSKSCGFDNFRDLAVRHTSAEWIAGQCHTAQNKMFTPRKKSSLERLFYKLLPSLPRLNLLRSVYAIWQKTCFNVGSSND